MADTRLRAVATAETCRGAFTSGQFAAQKRKPCARALPFLTTALSRAARPCAHVAKRPLAAFGAAALRPAAIVARPMPASR